MSIYTRKKGVYTKLTRDQVRRLQRVEDVRRLQIAAGHNIATMRALANWLALVQKKALKLDAKDLQVTRLPNVERLLSNCDQVDAAIKSLRGK